MKLLNKTELLNKLKDKYNDNWPPEIAEGFQKAVDIVEDAPTVEAIPIEWLKKWEKKNGLDCYDYDYPTEKNDWWYAVEKMLEDWGKENEID